MIEAATQPVSSYEIGVVIADRDAPGLNYARSAGIRTEVIAHPNRAVFAAAVEQVWIDAAVEIVALAGFMRILDRDLVERWNGQIINIHPSLLPDYPGLHPHRRVLEAQARISGCTVHLVTPEIDSGPIISQAVVTVLPDDTEQSLASRVLAAEHRLYPIVLDYMCSKYRG